MNENGKKLAGNVILIVLAVSLVAFLVFAKIQNKKQVERAIEEAAEYETVNASRAEANAIYEDLVQSINLPDIVLLGDAGAVGGDANLATSFNNTANDKVIGDFKNAYTTITINSVGDDLTFNMADKGVVGESMREITARAGGLQMVTANSFAIPAGKADEVNLTLMDTSGKYLHFAHQDDAEFDKVTISDISGTLEAKESVAAGSDDSQSNLYFSREEDGEETQVRAWTRVNFGTAEEKKPSVPVLYFDSLTPNEEDEKTAANDGGEDGADDAVQELHDYSYAEVLNFTSKVNSIIDAYAPSAENEQYVVIATVPADSYADKTLKQRLGDHYLRNDKLAANMTEEDYSALAAQVYDFLDSKGTFDDAKKKVDSATKKLKDL